MRLASLLVILATALPPVAPAQEASPPTFKAEAQVVLLDVVARDAKGRLVHDLRAEELQVFEDGKHCAIRSFRLVRAGARDLPPSVGSGAAPTSAPLETSAPSQANLVVLLFDPLYRASAPYARQAALDLLDQRFPPNTWFAVFKVHWRGMQMLQFTGDRDDLRAAVMAATAGDVPGAPPDTFVAPPLRSLGFAQQVTSPYDIAAGAEAHLRELTVGMRDDLTFYGVQAIARGLAAVRGRKAIVYFAADRQLGGGEIAGGRGALVYAAAMNEANRANVSIHTVDVRGLTVARVGGRGPLEESFSAAGSTRFPTDPWTVDTANPASALNGSLFVRARARFLSYKSGSLLSHVAQETGGLAISGTNDLRAGVAHIIDELREYYEVVYAPPNPILDGRFRRIQAKCARRGVEVRTRAGYFATPTTAPTLAAFELTLIAALSLAEPPRAFPHEAQLVAQAAKGGDREVEFLAEVPLEDIRVAGDTTRGTYSTHLSLLAFIKDEAGRPLVRLSHDWPVEGKLDEAGRAPNRIAFRRELSLPPGRYAVESAFLDRGAGRISVVRTPSEIPAVEPARD
jgi:VWFA-related protein